MGLFSSNNSWPICFALLHEDQNGYRDSKFSIILKKDDKTQKISKVPEVAFSNNKESLLTGESWRTLTSNMSYFYKVTPVLVEMEIRDGTVEKPRKVRIIKTQRLTVSEVDPSVEVQEYETYQPRTAVEMNARPGESEAEIKASRKDIRELSEESRNLLSPFFIKQMVLEVERDCEESELSLVEINGKKVALLGGTEIDGGIGMPSLTWVYNLRKVSSYDAAALYFVDLYEKIDEGKPAYAYYTPCSGANDEPPELIEII